MGAVKNARTFKEIVYRERMHKLGVRALKRYFDEPYCRVALAGRKD